MAKDSMSALNEVYDKILGEGQPLTEEEAGDGAGHAEDGAYGQEDYLDEAGDGTDPRDEENDDDDFLDVDDDTDDDDDGTDEDDTDEENNDNDDEYEEIPQRLIDAGRAGNLSDEAIVELSETRPEALEALARAFEASSMASRNASMSKFSSDKDKEAGQQGTEEDVDDGFKPLKLDFDQDEIDELGPKAMGIINQLADAVNGLGEKVNTQSQSIGSVQQREVADRVRQIDSHFDKIADKIPELGKSGSLTEEQKQNRIFAVKSARAAMESFGITSDEEALTIGAKALKGQKTDAQVKEQLIRDLDKNKKRFTGRGRSRQRPGKKRTTQQRAMDAINRVLDSNDY